MMTVAVAVLLSVASHLALPQVTAAMACNGLTGLCDLRLNQVTFPGTHNSGAGFSGRLYKWGGELALQKYYRNQQLTITGQLDFGIRYFDIDTCYVKKTYDDYWTKGAWACHGSAYAGRVHEILRQMDEWLRMPAHSNEVIIIDINRDVEKGNEKLIYEDILKDLKELWEPTYARVRNKELSISDRQWPTLREAVRSNQRIFVFMTEKILLHATDQPDWITNSEWQIKITWPQINRVDKSCSGVVPETEKRCGRYGSFGLLRLDVYMTSYIWSTWNAQEDCDYYMGTAMEKCYAQRNRFGATVNIIVADWVDLARAPNTVTAVARVQNLINIQKFRKRRYKFYFL